MTLRLETIPCICLPVLIVVLGGGQRKNPHPQLDVGRPFRTAITGNASASRKA